MPPVEVVFYQESEGVVPVLDWLRGLAGRDRRIVVKCRERIERLAQLGHELRRPEADLLRDGVYELRIRWGSVNYRILYFFHGRTAAILAHGLAKESGVPDKDIDLAVKRSRTYAANPEEHQYREVIEDGDEENDE